MSAVWVLCEFSLLVSQQNNSDLSLNALDDALKKFYQNKGVFREQKMPKSAKAKVHDLLESESHLLCERKIHMICVAREAVAYGAEKVSTTKRRQCQVRLNRAQQAATTWSDADHHETIERLKREIDQVTPAKRKSFKELFWHHERQLLQAVVTKVTGPRSIFDKELPLSKAVAEHKPYGAVNMSTIKRLPFHNHLSDAEIEATTWSLADSEGVINQLEREIYGITSNEQMRLKREFSLCLIEFEAWWETIGIQTLRKTIEQCVIHFRYPKMYLVSHMSKSIWRVGSVDNFTTDISEWLHIAKVNEAYRSSNKVNYICQMLKHNDWCTSLDYMEETLSYLALQGCYNIDSAKVFNQLSATDQWRSTYWVYLLRLQTIQDKSIIHPESQQVYHLRETHVHGVGRSIKSTSLRDASEDFGIPNFGQLFHPQNEEYWGYKVSGLVLGYDQNVLLDSIFITLQYGLLYYRQPFHCPTSVERLGLDCKVEYTNANQGIMPESHNIWVLYTQSEENDPYNTFQGWITSFPVLYFSWTPLNQLLQFQDHLPAGKALSTVSKRCEKTQQWVLRPHAQEYAVVIPTMLKNLHGWADCVDGFIWVVKQMNKMHILPIRAVVGPAHLGRDNAASGGINSVWVVNNHVDLDTYWTVYYLE